MKHAAILTLILPFTLPASPADAWRAEVVAAPGKVTAVETIDKEVRVVTDKGWFRVVVAGQRIALEAAAPPRYPPLPRGALPDGRIAVGTLDIARVWLAAPTKRYGHGALGDKVEAGALVIQTINGRRSTVTLPAGAVFEDLAPRIADLGDGRDSVIVVKSYLKRGAALAVVGKRKTGYAILAETPAIGTAHRWLDPAGTADFDGDGVVEIALVLMPHAVGQLELRRWRDGVLQKTAAVSDTSNHSFGTRALFKSAVADFDGDGIADLAIPSFDQRSLRLIAFAPQARDIARVKLRSRTKTDFGLLRDAKGKAVVVVGLEDGTLVAMRK